MIPMPSVDRLAVALENARVAVAPKKNFRMQDSPKTGFC